MKINIICGTNRNGSLSLEVSKFVETVYQELGHEVWLTDLKDLPKEVISPDIYKEKPESLKRLTAKVIEADGLVLVVPEYNGSYPGILKLFIDLLPFPESFESKPVCFIGLSAGQWGALRAVEQLQQVFGYRNAIQFPKRVFISKLRAADMLSKETRERIEQQSSNYSDFLSSLSS